MQEYLEDFLLIILAETLKSRNYANAIILAETFKLLLDTLLRIFPMEPEILKESLDKLLITSKDYSKGHPRTISEVIFGKVLEGIQGKLPK